MTKVTVNFECKEEFLKVFDAAIDGKYDNRSEAIRDSMRRRIRELQGVKA